MKTSILSILCFFFWSPLLVAQCWDGQVNFQDTFLHDVHFIGTQTGWVVGDSGLIRHTVDGGVTWIPQETNGDDGLKSVFFINEMAGWAVGDGEIWKFTNTGTWAPINNPSSQELFGVFFANASLGWAVGWEGTILKSFNGGNDWNSPPSGTTEALFDVFFIDEDIGWAVGSNGIVLKTTNGGESWPMQQSITSNHLESVYFVNELKGWAVGEAGTIFVTTDGGTNWTEQSSGASSDLKDVQFLDAKNGWAVGEVDLLQTSDGGITWTNQTFDPAGGIQAAFLVDAQNGWAVGKEGTVYKYSGGLDLTFRVSNVVGNLGEMVQVDILTEGFSLENFSFSIKWDTTALDFIFVETTINSPAGLDINDFNQDSVGEGLLGVSWSTPSEVIDVPDQTAIFQITFRVRETGCVNSPINFANVPTPITANSNTFGCRVVKLKPGVLIVPCDLPVNIPGFAETRANTEYLDSVEWTHYFNQDSIEEDTILISVKKNGQDIGKIGDGIFNVQTSKELGITDITALIQSLPGYADINQAFAWNYFWEVTPNYGDPALDTTLGLRFYFSEADIDFLRVAMGNFDLEAEHLNFFKLNVEPEKNTCNNLAAVENPEIDVFVHAVQAGPGNWTLDQFGTNSLVGEMDIAGFSCGGIFITDPLVSVKEISSINHVVLSPNPSDGHFNLSLWLKKPDKLNLNIFNSLGAALFQQTLVIPGSSFQTGLQLDHLPPGIFFLQLKNGKGEQTVRKFVINH